MTLSSKKRNSQAIKTFTSEVVKTNAKEELAGVREVRCYRAAGVGERERNNSGAGEKDDRVWG